MLLLHKATHSQYPQLANNSMIFKQLPTMISDLNKLGIALKSLDAMKIGTVGVNAANIEAYRTALKGLSVEQSVFALASKGATKEQIRQILVTNQATASEVEAAMAKAGLTTATKALTQAEMVEMATKNGVAKAEAEALLSKIGITATEEGQVVVKKQVTLAMLEQAVASGTLTKAEASQIATMLGLNAAETTNIGITNVLTASFTKLWAVITAHPIGAILTAIGAVAVGTIAYINKVNKDAKKALVEAHENAEKALEDTKTSLSDDKSELQSINSELEQTKDKIREISSIGAPTLTEQNELDKLSTANAQLEIQKSLLENNIKLKQKSAALDAKELLGTQVEMEYSSILDNSSITSKKESYTYVDHAKYQASNLKNAYNIYMKALEEGNVRRQELAQELIDASAGNTAELTSKLLEIVESFKYDDGTIIDGYEDIYNEYMGMIYNLQSLTNPDTFLDIAKSITVGTGIDYEKAISEAYDLAYEGNFDVDNLNQDFVKALADAGIDKSTIDYIFSLKQQEYQLLIDKINDKYKVSEVPDKIKQDYWDANGNIHSEYVDVDEETKNRIEEINTINQYLNDYAKENPVEFQLVTSYDEGFTLLDEYIEEEKKKAENNTDYVGDYITNAIARIYDEAKVKSETFNDETDILPEIPQTVSDLKDLNSELDNLGNAIANIDAEGKFDLNDLDSIADYFLGLEDIPYNIEAVNKSLKSLGDGNATLEEQTDAINTLADQYLKTSGILDDLNSENAELIKLQLQRMGIVNAEEIVNATLNGTLQSQTEIEGILAQHKSIVTGETLTLYNVTAEEIQALLDEGSVTSETANQMAILAIKKQLVNGTTLDTSADINNLIALCKTLGASISALERYNQVKNGANGMPSYVVDKYREAAERELQTAIKTGQSSLKATYTSVPKAIYNGGSNVANALNDANKEVSSSAKETEDTYEELFDFFERRVSVLNDALDLLNTNLDNVIGSSAKNTLIDAQIGINKESINNYTDALAMYTQKANEALAKIPAEFQSKIVDGSVSLTDFIGSGNEDLVNAINDYQNWSDKIADCKQNLAELKQSLRQLELDKFNNIIEEFTKQFDISTNAQDLINKQIDLFEEAGQLIGKGFYEGLIKESESQLSILEQEKQSLINELNTGLQNGLIEKGTDEWLEMVNALNEVDGSILDCKKDIEEFNNSIQELHWDIIDKIQKNFDDLSGEISNLIGLIDDVDVSDAEGIWSTEGLTQLGLYTQEYEKSLYAVKMYEDEIVSLNDAYLRGEYSATEYADKLSELKDAQWDEINASESAKDAIMELNEARIDIMVTAIEEEIDAMKELIDSKKEALDSEKDLYEYRKSISEKSKNVADLEKQIAATENDNTQEGIARRKKLEAELVEAKQDLADYEYEHSIDVQKDALDQQYEDFETEKNAEIEALKATLEDREAVISASFENVKNNANLIGAEIGLIAETHGAIVSNSLVSSWTSGENAIASYGETLSVGTSNFLLNMGNMVQGVYGLQSQSDATAVSLANMYNTSSANLQSELLSSYYSVANLNAVTQTLNDSLINTLNRGYDVSSIVNSLNSVGNAASSAANQVAGLMSALSGSGNTGGYTYTNKYQNDSENKNGIVTVYDSNGNIVAVTTRENAEKNYGATNKYAIKKYAKGGIVTKDDNNPLNNIAKAVGEDTLIAAKEGEVVLKPSEADALLKLAPNIEAFNNYIPKLIPDINMPSIPTYTTNNQQPSVQIHYDNLVQVQGDVNNSNIRQMEQIVDNAITKQFNQFNSSLRKAGVR